MIDTWSQFYYIESVTPENFYLDFSEGEGELTAEVEVGEYTPEGLAIAVQNALNSAGELVYTVTFNRKTRAFTISADGEFSLLTTSGSHVSADIFPLIGFEGADRSGESSYSGQAAANVYRPQYLLQNYVDEKHLRRAAQGTVNKAADGTVEVVRFGVERFFEMSIHFITNIDQGPGSIIETNLNGVADAEAFMQFLITKREVEFMKDRDNPDDFVKLILESTDEDQNGLGYRLKELYSKGLPNYFETGILKFRVIEG